MPHVGIQRLGTGQRQHHSPENGDADARMADEEVHRPHRVDRLQHFGTHHDALNAEHAEHREPQHHHRPEQNADARRTVLLDHEQADQQHHGDRHHPVPQGRQCHFQPLDRGQHRYRRGDHAVAIEQRRAEQAEQHQHRAQARITGGGAAGQRGQGHYPALATIVGAQHEQHVLERHHPEQRPEDQREDAQHALGVDTHPVMPGEHLLEGVERAGADVAVDHAGGGHQQAEG